MRKFPLFLVLFGALGVIAFLLQAGHIGPRSAPSPEVQRLLTAARRGDLVGVEQALADGADVNVREPSDKETALLRAARMGEAEMVSALLAAGADPDIGNRLSLTPLHAAARSGATEVISALIAGGATVDVHEDEQGLTPLHDAALELHVEAVRILLAAGADPDARKKYSASPALGVAVEESQLDLVTLLVEAGADANADAGFGVPLHRALRLAQDEDPAMVRLLIEWGADLDEEDDEGRTVLEAARELLAQESREPYVSRRRRTLDVLEELGGEG